MRYFLVAGEASGDLHGASLMRELKAIDANAEFCFLGGDLMQQEGGTLVQHYKNMAFMGIVNVILNLKKNRKKLQPMYQGYTSILSGRSDIDRLSGVQSESSQICKNNTKHTCILLYSSQTMGVERVSNKNNKTIYR